MASRVEAARSETPAIRAGLLSGFDRTHGDGVVLLRSADSRFGAGLLVERGQRGFIADFERVDLVANDERVLRTFRDAGAGTSRVVAGHGVLSAAHGITDRSRESFSAGGRSGNRHTDYEQQAPESKSSFRDPNIHHRFS